MPQQKRPQLDSGPDISLLADELQGQWHEQLNRHLGHVLIKPYSHRKVWWSCDQCPEGLPHVWEAHVHNRSQGAAAQARRFVSTTRLPERHLKLRCFGMPRRTTHCHQIK